MERDFYNEGWLEGYNTALSELREKMGALWSNYARNPDDIPKPDFKSAYAMVIIMQEGKKNV